MNTLIFESLETAVETIRAGGTLRDGTIVVAPAAAIECRVPREDVLLVEEHARDEFGDKPAWHINHGMHGVASYTLLVARRGIEKIHDANGDDAGYRVIGTTHVNA